MGKKFAHPLESWPMIRAERDRDLKGCPKESCERLQKGVNNRSVQVTLTGSSGSLRKQVNAQFLEPGDEHLCASRHFAAKHSIQKKRGEREEMITFSEEGKL